MPGLVGIVSKDGGMKAGSVLSAMLNAITRKDWYTVEEYVDQKHTTAIGKADLGIANRAPQPWFSEDSALCVFIYGEIYHCEDEGVITGRDDVPAIVARGYKKKGREFFNSLTGDFSIAIHDLANQKLLLVNDRFGRQPVYYSRIDGNLVFSSEVKSILVVPGFSRSVSEQALAEIISFGYVLGDQTLFSGIELLPPGSTLEYDCRLGEENVTGYWNLAENLDPLAGDDRTLLAQLADTFRTGVHRQLEKDRMTSVSLSGGMDSRAIMAVIDPNEYPVRSFTSGIVGSYDEKVTGKIAGVTGCQHTFYTFDDEFLSGSTRLEYTAEAIAFTDGMRGASFSSVTAYLAKRNHAFGFDTLLTGHGGELAKLDKAYCFTVGRGQDPGSGHSAFLSWAHARMTRATLGRIDGRDLFSESFSGKIAEASLASLESVLGKVNQDLPIEQKISFLFLNEFFRKRAFYALAVQRAYALVRLPFFDDDFMGLVLRTPMRLRKKHAIHLEIMKRYRPELLNIPLTQTRSRPAAGRFERLVHNIPYNLLQRLGFFRRDTPENFLSAVGDAGYFEKVLGDGRLQERGLVNRQCLRKVLENYQKGERRYHHLLHMLAMIELWHRMYVDESASCGLS